MGPRRSPPGGNLKVSELLGFLPKQEEAFQHLFSHRYVLYGGSRGPGKSYWLRWSLVGLLLYWFITKKQRGVHVGLFCETYPDLRDRQISKIKLEFPLWLGEVKETQADGLCFILRDEYGGGVICLRNLDKAEKYQSAEFAAVAVDELTKNTEETFHILRGSLRWPGIDWTVFLSASNPGGRGHAWVKRLWIDGNFPPELRALASQFAFIPALPDDNPYLTQTYWNELENLPERLRRAWRLGQWDAFEGQLFPIFSRAAHVVTPFEVPSWWPSWGGLDWGYAAPFCDLTLVRDPARRRMFAVHEIYAPRLTDRQQAETILELTQTWHRSLTYADPSMWAKKNMAGVVSSSADEYAIYGVPLLKGDNNRRSGKRKIDRVLAPLQDGIPGLQIFSTCTNLIKQLEELSSDPNDPEVEADDQEDHAYAALRYGLTGEHSLPEVLDRKIDPARRRDLELAARLL